MTPDIHKIVETCKSISQKIIFFLPRTMILEDLFRILEEHYDLNEIFLDVQILNSANKIKAVMIIFGANSEDVY